MWKLPERIWNSGKNCDVTFNILVIKWVGWFLKYAGRPQGFAPTGFVELPGRPQGFAPTGFVELATTRVRPYGIC